MPKFDVSASVTISVLKTITAKNEKEAREKAEALTVPSLCYQCSEAGKDDDETWELTGELDGTATEIKVKKA